MPVIKGDSSSNPKATSPYMIELISHDSYTFPIFVLVEVKYQETGDRLNPPEASNGFVCKGSPYDKGHVCALEIGGPDIPENIVPQWEAWQEHGAWRKMESQGIRGIADNGDLYLCKVDWLKDLQFKGAAPIANSSTYLDYAAEELMSWSDYRIPLGFNIWVIKKGSKAYGTLTSSNLSDSDVGTTFRTYAGSHVAPITFKLQDMPTEDRLMHEGNQIRGAFGEFVDVMKDVHQNFINERVEELQLTKKMTSRVASVEAKNFFGIFEQAELLRTFDDSHAEIVREILRESYNFDKSECDSLSTHRLLQAVENSHVGNPVKRLRSESEASHFRALNVRAKSAREKRREKMKQKAITRKLKTRVNFQF